jgi:alpha/beta hydrolase fold
VSCRDESSNVRFCDPKSHRPLCVKLAKLSKCRVLSLRYLARLNYLHRYRLAPQSKWPKQLIDLLLAYSYLVHPPSDAWHKPTSPSKIIFSGDSSGVPPLERLTSGRHRSLWTSGATVRTSQRDGPSRGSNLPFRPSGLHIQFQHGRHETIFL